MTILFTALSPIFALIFIGYGFKRIGFPSDNFWPSVDRLTYYALVPALLVHKLATAKIDDSLNAFAMVEIVLVMLAVLSLLLMLWQKFLPFDAPVYTSVYQGAIRFNTYVFLALVDNLYGDKGIVLAAFLITFAIPFINVLCVSTFGFYINEGKFSFGKLWLSIIKNPLIIACMLGGFLNFGGVGLPFGVAPIIKMFGSPAIPLGLLSIGVGLRFKSLGTFKADFWIASVAKLVILPLLGFGGCFILGVDGLMRDVVILFCAMPTAVSAYILAREMGGDAGLMATLITGQTLLAIATLSGVMAWLL